MTTPEMKRGWAASRQAIEEQKAAAKNNAFDFYLKNGAGADIIFLDDDPIIAKKHTIPAGAKRYLNFLCLGEGCPGCEAGNRPATVGFFTVLLLTHVPAVDEPKWDSEHDWDLIEDADEIRTKDGNLIKNPVRLLTAKQGTLGILDRQFDKRDGLVGARFQVFRTHDSKSPNVGDQWDFDTKYTEEQIAILNPNAEPLDYDKALPILSADEISRQLNGVAAGSGNSGGGSRGGFGINRSSRDKEPAEAEPAAAEPAEAEEEADEKEERPASRRRAAAQSDESERSGRRMRW